jgi:hypothetical protein
VEVELLDKVREARHEQVAKSSFNLKAILAGAHRRQEHSANQVVSLALQCNETGWRFSRAERDLRSTRHVVPTSAPFVALPVWSQQRMRMSVHLWRNTHNAWTIGPIALPFTNQTGYRQQIEDSFARFRVTVLLLLCQCGIWSTAYPRRWLAQRLR